MMKQSNINYDDLKLLTNLINTKNQCKQFTEREGRNESFSFNIARFLHHKRHELIVTTTTKQSEIINKSKISKSFNQLRQQIKETNINATIIDIVENSSSHCSLIDKDFTERLHNYSTINCNTNENLNKLQKITDDVKLLTKQVQLSINNNNKNNNSSSSTLDERFIGEICYQLERRILNIIFSPSKQLYGYSLRYLSSIIKNESKRSLYKKRFLELKNHLSKTHFNFNYHPIITFNLINQYGIYDDYEWLYINSNILSDINQIKTYSYRFLSKNVHSEDFDIILNSLELISNIDKKPLFYW